MSSKIKSSLIGSKCVLIVDVNSGTRIYFKMIFVSHFVSKLIVRQSQVIISIIIIKKLIRFDDYDFKQQPKD